MVGGLRAWAAAFFAKRGRKRSAQKLRASFRVVYTQRYFDLLGKDEGVPVADLPGCSAQWAFLDSCADEIQHRGITSPAKMNELVNRHAVEWMRAHRRVGA